MGAEGTNRAGGWPRFYKIAAVRGTVVVLVLGTAGYLGGPALWAWVLVRGLSSYVPWLAFLVGYAVGWYMAVGTAKQTGLRGSRLWLPMMGITLAAEAAGWLAPAILGESSGLNLLNVAGLFAGSLLALSQGLLKVPPPA